MTQNITPPKDKKIYKLEPKHHAEDEASHSTTSAEKEKKPGDLLLDVLIFIYGSADVFFSSVVSFFDIFLNSCLAVVILTTCSWNLF